MQDKQNELNNAKKEPCKLKRDKVWSFCKASYKDLYFLRDLEVDPALEDGSDLKLGVVRGYVDFGDSNKFFSGIVDKQGSPVQFDNRYHSVKFGASFSINKSISVKYSHFSANRGSGIKDEESFVISFDRVAF